MVITGLIKQGLIVAGAISLGLLNATPASAEPSFPSRTNKDGSPERRRAAGPRCPHECINTDQETLFALTPQGNQSLTMSSQPDFFFYLPPLGEDVRLQFELKQGGQRVYAIATTPTSSKGGIQVLSLADLPDAPHLQAGGYYDWSVTLDCLPSGESTMRLLVSSGLKVIEPDEQLVKQLEGANWLQQAELYAENGLWSDSLTALLQGQQLSQDAAQQQEAAWAWEQLLTSVGLEYFADRPLL